MIGFSDEKHVLTLIDEAIVQVSGLNGQGKVDILPVLERTRQVLANPVEAKRSVPLVLASLRGRVKDVEKYIARGMYRDNKADVNARSILIRVRVICAEVIRILDLALNDVRLSRARSDV